MNDLKPFLYFRPQGLVLKRNTSLNDQLTSPLPDLKVILIASMLLALSACQTQQDKTPTDSTTDSTQTQIRNQINAQRITPLQVTESPIEYKGRQALWGGTIISIKNTQRSTQLEVLSYPLRSTKPNLSKPSQGRFLAKIDGFLDPADFAPGNLVIINGIVSGVKQGRIGEAISRWAVLKANNAERVKPDADTPPWYKNIHIGIGIFTDL